MAKGKKGFLLYCDLLPTIEKLPDEIAGKVFKFILEYVNDKNPVVEDLLLQIVCEPIKNQLKRDLKSWEEKSLKRSEIGREGGLKSGEKRSKNKQNEPIGSKVNQLVKKNEKTKQNEHDTVNDNVTVNDTVFIKEGNFFYIGIEIYQSPISDYIKNYLTEFTNVWCIKNKELSLEYVLKEMDKICIGKQFNNDEHIRNTFIKTFKYLLKEKQYPTKNTIIKAASEPIPFQKEI